MLAAIGGVGGALARHADGVIAAMPPDVRAAARRVLVRLVGRDGTRIRAGLPDGARERPVAVDGLVAGRLVVG